MKIEELERSLPNGFHDAVLHSFAVVLERQQAEFVIEVSIGTPADPPVECNRYRAARLVLTGIGYFAVDPPGPGASIGGSHASMIDLVEADPATSAQAPLDGFSARFFVSDWNAVAERVIVSRMPGGLDANDTFRNDLVAQGGPGLRRSGKLPTLALSLTGACARAG
jgi:hypothetical protein